MDPSSVIVLVLVASGDLGDPATSAMTQTAEEALAGRAILVVRDVGRDPISDDQATRLGSAVHASAIAVISWSKPGRERAFVHMSTVGEPGWVDRSLVFGPDDPTAERGRMLGFEVAAIVHPSVVQPTQEQPPGRVAPEPFRRLAVDLVVVGAAGLGGPGAGLGGEGSIRFRLTEATALRAGAGVRIGEVAALHATTTTLRLAAGASTRLVEAGPVSAGIRLDLLALRHAALSKENDSSGSHWLAGMDGAVEGAWVVAPRIYAVGAMGVELAFGTTRLLLDDTRVAAIPAFRLVGELGIRIAF